MTQTDHDTRAITGARQVRQWLKACDRVLIGAGAGLSAAAGIDYTDPVSFARLFPALVRRGLQADYQLIGYDDWEPAEKWGYLATHVNDVRFGPRPHPVYGRLFDLVHSKDYFVLTSNVDVMFVRNGFEERRVFTPQGDYAAMQCLRPCRPKVWASQPIIERLLPAIDPLTQAITDAKLLPSCPYCGGEVFLNVRGGSWFVEEPYAEEANRFNNWLRESLNHPVLILEIGAGFNTPGVVRWPLEQVALANPSAKFFRVNLEHAKVPQALAGRSVSFRADALQVINTIFTKAGQ
jgi:NAD-dependent SIR2 family protein deacetylase